MHRTTDAFIGIEPTYKATSGPHGMILLIDIYRILNFAVSRLSMAESACNDQAIRSSRIRIFKIRGMPITFITLHFSKFSFSHINLQNLFIFFS